jgi:hypothetical protein
LYLSVSNRQTQRWNTNTTNPTQVAELSAFQGRLCIAELLLGFFLKMEEAKTSETTLRYVPENST